MFIDSFSFQASTWEWSFNYLRRTSADSFPAVCDFNNLQIQTTYDAGMIQFLSFLSLAALNFHTCPELKGIDGNE